VVDSNLMQYFLLIIKCILFWCFYNN
jgi:hypothetical protein